MSDNDLNIENRWISRICVLEGYFYVITICSA